MIHKGDRFIIEIGDILSGEDGKLYKVKGFNSLVFDDNGIKKLSEYSEVREFSERICVGDRVHFFAGSVFTHEGVITDVQAEGCNLAYAIYSDSEKRAYYGIKKAEIIKRVEV